MRYPFLQKSGLATKRPVPNTVQVKFERSPIKFPFFLRLKRKIRALTRLRQSLELQEIFVPKFQQYQKFGEISTKVLTTLLVRGQLSGR